jgi:hypothetical protein
MLEWQRLCQHLAKFSSTSIGKRLCLQLSVPLQEATSLRLQQDVRCGADKHWWLVVGVCAIWGVCSCECLDVGCQNESDCMLPAVHTPCALKWVSSPIARVWAQSTAATARGLNRRLTNTNTSPVS